jgi:acetate kinase
LSGGFNDIRDIEREAEQGNARARLALGFLAHETRRWIGSFHLELNGIDALVFTAGIGENAVGLRAAICDNLDRLGLRLDREANRQLRGREGGIHAPDAPVKILVVPTNEELVVAREVQRWLLHHH